MVAGLYRSYPMSKLLDDSHLLMPQNTKQTLWVFAG